MSGPAAFVCRSVPLRDRTMRLCICTDGIVLIAIGVKLLRGAL